MTGDVQVDLSEQVDCDAIKENRRPPESDLGCVNCCDLSDHRNICSHQACLFLPLPFRHQFQHFIVGTGLAFITRSYLLHIIDTLSKFDLINQKQRLQLGSF